MKTLNDLICATPFPFTGAQTETRGSGLKQVANFTGLVGLRVLADGPDGVQKGDTVYVSGRDVKTYGQNKFKLPDGTECIFVPKSSVYLKDFGVPSTLPRATPHAMVPPGYRPDLT
jgi:hypothetical protein